MSGVPGAGAAPSASEDAGVAAKSAEKGASGGGAHRRSCTLPGIPKQERERTVAEPSGMGVGVQDKGLQQIRARSSYPWFRELHELLRDKPEGAAVLRMTKRSQSAAVAVQDALFFPEDFTRLHRRHIVYIKRGVIIDLDKLPRRPSSLGCEEGLPL